MVAGKHKDPAWLTALEPYVGDDVEHDLRVITLHSIIVTMASILARVEGTDGALLSLARAQGFLAEQPRIATRRKTVPGEP